MYYNYNILILVFFKFVENVELRDVARADSVQMELALKELEEKVD
jgi:hypothetical protein